MKFSYLLPLTACLLIAACKIDDPNHTEESKGKPGFQLLSADRTGITFRNDIEETPDNHGLLWDALYYGGGVGIGDINNDGLEDLFFAGNQTDDALYLNKGNLQFEDISASSGITAHPGWSNGVAMVDINSDGFLDIYVCRTSWKMDHEDPDFRRNKLFINNGDLSFTESASAYGLDDQGYAIHAVFLDYDKDGDLDMFLMNSPSNNLAQKVRYIEENAVPNFTSDRFFRNDGGRFTDITKKAGVSDNAFGLGVVAADIDHDNWVDIYVANDYEKPDFLYINQRDGTFKNMLSEKVKHICFTSMGCDAADINNDGLADIGVLDMQSSDHVRSKTNMPSMNVDQFWGYVKQGYHYQYMSNTLQLNNGFGYFSDIAHYAGIASTEWSWAILMADFDNDRYKDILVTNGINRDLRNNDFALKLDRMKDQKDDVDLFALSREMPSTPTKNYLFHNDGRYQFPDVTEAWGLDQETFSYGAAYADLDQDGDLDLVINNNNERAFIYENRINKRRGFIKVKIKGHADNPAGLGTKVFIFQENDIQYQELSPYRGYQSTCTFELLFGLGDHADIDSLVCIFPDNTSIRRYDVQPNTVITLAHADAGQQPLHVYTFDKPVFKAFDEESGILFHHRENAYDDFAEEILLPHALSTRGPYQAVGDINGDGLDDLFIGGAAGQPGVLMVQNASGKFEAVEGPWRRHAAMEDMGCAFLDFDSDGDTDLYVASGGNASDTPEMYADRLYRNEGNGTFSNVSNLLPTIFANSSCVEVADFDQDGDPDIFVGGLVEYKRYPYPGESVLLRNEDGRFVNITDEIAEDLQFAGVVTDAVWADINDDQKPDLIVVGEWMSPVAFINTNGRFEKNTSWIAGQENLAGWYTHINTTDLNRDSDPEFILGNFGTNNKYHPSPEKPLKVYTKDFDGNSTNDIVLAKPYGDHYVPVRGRECSSQQMPFVAEKFPTYTAYANASLEQIYEEKLDQALQLEVRNFRSGLIMSSASGYVFNPLPPEAQFFPVMSSIVRDFDNDGAIDILLVGNLFDAEVETTRHDSGNGLVLFGKEDGSFRPTTVLNNGFYAPFNARSLALLTNTVIGKDIVVVGSSDERTVVYTQRQ